MLWLLIGMGVLVAVVIFFDTRYRKAVKGRSSEQKIQIGDIIAEQIKNYRNSERGEKILEKRKKVETPIIIERILSDGIENQKVSKVGDICWYNYFSDTEAWVLIVVQFATGEIALASYDGFEIKRVNTGKFIFAIELLEELPKLELDDDHIDVRIKDEYSLMAQHIDDEWSLCGEEWTGKSGYKKFIEHGFTFSAGQIE